MLNKSIAWLLQEVDNFRQQRRYRQALLDMTKMIVDIADPKIRLANGYPDALIPSVEAAMTYCQGLVASIPGPVRLDHNRYFDDPLVKIIFSSAKEMEVILRHARDKKPQFECKEIVALLTMNRTEKTIFSHQQQGNLLLRDVAMRTVNFSEHRIVAPAANLQTTKAQLELRCLEVLATMAKQKIAVSQENLVELREHRERITFMLRVLGSSRPLTFGRSTHETCKIRELEQMLAVIEKKIEQAKKELFPEDILNHLKQIIGTPEDLLFLYQYSLCVNWMNVLIENGDQNECNKITLVEVTIDKDMQRRPVLLVCFDRN